MGEESAGSRETSGRGEERRGGEGRGREEERRGEDGKTTNGGAEDTNASKLDRWLKRSQGEQGGGKVEQQQQQQQQQELPKMVLVMIVRSLALPVVETFAQQEPQNGEDSLQFAQRSDVS
eukprot:763239-Hanusia_phi.AAC.4